MPAMQWVVLGSGCCIPSAQRLPSAHLLKIGRESLIFDIGPGSVNQLVKAGFKLKDLNHVFISHFTHPDHVNDLIFLLMAFKVGAGYGLKRAQPLRIYGPKGLRVFVNKICRLYPFLKELGFKLNLHELKPNKEEKLKAGGKEVVFHAFKAEHPNALSYVFLVQGKKIVYSGDTGFHRQLVVESEGADLLVFECSNPFGSSGHLNPEFCGQIASHAQAKKLLLTHFYPSFKKSPAKLCRQHFKGKIIEAKDLLKVKV